MVRCIQKGNFFADYIESFFTFYCHKYTQIQILIQTTSINQFTISTRILQPDWLTYFYVIDSE